ncbi:MULTISPECIES: hypothetical protein [Paraburkholderia]|jgi:aspartate oxidase|uniref:Uncharacterized protein n=1 Tax=Paraburkholderia strydomiana TaxID=1245417 RepID=A0ABW9BY28_9BURK
MASQVGNVSRGQMCANSSTKHANGGIAIDCAGARDSMENCAADSRAGLDGRCSAQTGGNSDQHASRLHVIRDV